MNVSAGSENPLDVNISTGGPQWDGKSPDDVTLYYVITTGSDYVETMEMEIADGRTFSREFGSDSLNVVINETAARTMGMEEPVGQRLALWGREGQIIGVVKDFHMSTMYNPIQPLILRLEPEDPGYVFIRAAAGQTQAAVATFERAFNQFNPEFPFEYTFLDTEFDEAYRSEVVVGKLVSYFAWLAIVVACLGLFGLAAFTAARRTREIGIRKVLGGSVAHVVVLLSQDFLKLVVIGFAIGAPVAYYLMNGWLSGFAYHTRLGPSVFLGTAASVTFVALVTVGYQSLKAALANPATSLRSE